MKSYLLVLPIFAAALAAFHLSCRDTAPDSRALLGQVQSLLYEQERAGDALALATKALDSDPGNAMLRYHRGMAQMALRKEEAALDDFAAAMKIDPENPMVYNGFGNIFYLKYDDVIAERYWSRGLGLSRDSSTKALFLGNISLLSSSKKKYSDALKQLAEALSLSADGRYYNLMGRIYLAQNDRKKARETWQKAVADPSVTWAQASFRHNTLYRLAELLLSSREYREAFKYSGMALDLSPATREYQKLYTTLYGLAK
jgi:tetratricopeptide (TPR) repeat protein